MSEQYQPPTMYQARVIRVIETTLLRRGDGKSVDTAIRLVTQYWSLDGRLLAEADLPPSVSSHMTAAEDDALGVKAGGILTVRHR